MCHFPSIMDFFVQQLSNGQNIPAIGLGTYGSSELTDVVKKAIDIGYRMFDTAFIYQNECYIGEGVRKKIEDGCVKREDIFIISKLWNTKHKPEDVPIAIKNSILEMQLDYIDLYLMHWPFACKEKEDPYEISQLEEEYVPIEDTWRAMEELVECGYTKSIGFSNFNIIQMNRILSIAKIKPVVHEMECNPYMNQKKIIEYCKINDITVISHSPLWNINARPDLDLPSLYDQSTIKNLAIKYGKTATQIILRYLVQIGTIPIPKTDKESRLKENFDIFNFVLDSNDVSEMDQLNRNLRCCPYLPARKFKEYPFSEE